MTLLNEIVNNERKEARNAKVQWMREQGISVEFMPNGKMKIEDPQGRIDNGDFMIYDMPERAIEMAYSIVQDWLTPDVLGRGMSKETLAQDMDQSDDWLSRRDKRLR